jgi:hypothetical protein
MNVHIHRPSIVAARTRRRHCPTCRKRRTMLGWFQEWYGWNVTCLGCGDSWQDGEMMERPFKRAWRTKAIESARKMRDDLAGLPECPPVSDVAEERKE